MSKNITVSEGNTARVFGNTKKLETRLQGEDAGTCFWVPEDETEVQPLYITENGLYEASEAGVYGFSEAHVNISKKVTDDDGTDWNIHIDDDGIPHITVDDPDDPYTGTDISIDDGTGDIDVHSPGKDPDDWPEWDNLDPDVKPEFDDWMDDPKIPGDWPGWDDLAPEIVDEFDNWIDDGNDPDLWPGWDDLDPDEKTDFDDWMDDPKDPDDWPGWEDIDPEIKTDFDDWTADIDTEIDPDEAGLDPDEDVDASFDPDEQDVDMVGTDGDGNESVVSYDPRTGESEQELCPASFKILQEPTKTQYTHGQAIDYSGIVVQAFDANGKRITGKGYPDGNIPLSALKFSQGYADYKNGAPTIEAPPYSDDVNINGNGSVTQLVDFLDAGMRNQLNDLVLDTYLLAYRESHDESLQSVLNELSGVNGSNCIVKSQTVEIKPGSTGYTMYPVLSVYVFDDLPAHPRQGVKYPYTLYEWNYTWSYTGKNEYLGPRITRGSRTVFQGAKNGEVSTINMETGEDRSNKIMVTWEGPCYREFADSFNITVVDSASGGAGRN